MDAGGDFRIDTEVRGGLETGGTVMVGPQGSVVGDIRPHAFFQGTTTMTQPLVDRRRVASE